MAPESAAYSSAMVSSANFSHFHGPIREAEISGKLGAMVSGQFVRQVFRFARTSESGARGDSASIDWAAALN